MRLGTKIKSEPDIEDYDIDYEKRGFLEGDETISSASADYTSIEDDETLVIDSVQVFPTIVKVWVSGGTNGNTYRINVVATTTNGRRKEVCFDVRVRSC